MLDEEKNVLCLLLLGMISKKHFMMTRLCSLWLVHSYCTNKFSEKLRPFKLGAELGSSDFWIIEVHVVERRTLWP